MKKTLLAATLAVLKSPHAAAIPAAAGDRPNILFCFSDDRGRNASIYRDPDRPGRNDVIKTPALDRIRRSGAVFKNAFASAPSRTPCRASVSTGMPFYRCGSNAFLHFQEYGRAKDPYKSLPGFSELLHKSGYHVMHWGKTTTKPAGRIDQTHALPVNYFSQAVSAAGDKKARKRSSRRVIDDGKTCGQKPFIDPAYRPKKWSPKTLKF